MKQKFKAQWSSLESGTKKKLMLGTVAAVFIFTALFFRGYFSEDKSQKKNEKGTILLKEDEYVQEKWLKSAESKLNEMESLLESQNEEIRRLKNQLDRNGGAGPSSEESFGGRGAKQSSPGQGQDTISFLRERLSETPVRQPNWEDVAPPSPTPAQPAPQPKPNPQPSKSQQDSGANDSPRPSQGQQQAGQVQGQPARAPKSVTVLDFAQARQDAEQANATAKDEAREVYIPSGSFVRGMLLTGLNAPTGAKASSSPYPVLIRLQDLSFLPNEVRQDMAGCRIIGEGYGELSSERASIRLVSLSCVERESKSVLDIPAKGYVVGSDGKIGLRGNVVSKQGMFLAQTLRASFVEGIAEAFKTSQQTIVTTDSGTVSSPDTVESFSDGFLSGTSSGVSNAASKLSDFYMTLAEEIFPVIEVGAMRDLTVVFSQPVSGNMEKKYK